MNMISLLALAAKATPRNRESLVEKNPILQEIVDKLYKYTMKWGKEQGLAPDIDTDSLPEKERKLMELIIISGRFGEYSRPLAELVDLLSDGKTTLHKFIPKRKAGRGNIVSYQEGVIIVPINGAGGHSYPIGYPCILMDRAPTERLAIDINRERGNHLSPEISSIRLPSRDEVEDLVASFILSERLLLWLVDIIQEGRD